MNKLNSRFYLALVTLILVTIITTILIAHCKFDPWQVASFILFLLIIITLSFIYWSVRNGFPLHNGGSGFEESEYFDENQRRALQQHYSRMQGTLKFWKNRACLFGWIQKSTVLWSITTAVLFPIIIQFFDPTKIWAKIFVTGLSTFSAIMIAVNRAFRAEQLYQSYRVGESKFYDLRRRLLDTPQSFGATPEEQIKKYFEISEKIRLATRQVEINSQPSSDPIQ